MARTSALGARPGAGTYISPLTSPSSSVRDSIGEHRQIFHSRLRRLHRVAVIGELRQRFLHQQHRMVRQIADIGHLLVAVADHEDGVPDRMAGRGHGRHEHVDGVVVLGDPMFFFERDRIATLAIAARLPTVFALREHVEAGGLMSYGVDQRANFRRAADLVDKILKGTKPGELPVELPTKFELVINLKTAKAIGITIAESFLVRADEVIE